MLVDATASQTVGPYFHIGFAWLTVADLAPPGVAGERVTLSGRVLDGDARPVSDAVLEVWQADADGRYAHPEHGAGPRDARFRGFGRVWTDAAGAFRFSTVKPGRVPGPGGALQAPHLAVAVFMRGLLKHLVTRVYFPGEASNAEDPILNLVEAPRRRTLVARASAARPGALEWDVVLQGEDETVFFDC
jgi:protocatechuate 3,4-dioxygenase alpha subunit